MYDIISGVYTLLYEALLSAQSIHVYTRHQLGLVRCVSSQGSSRIIILLFASTEVVATGPCDLSCHSQHWEGLTQGGLHYQWDCIIFIYIIYIHINIVTLFIYIRTWIRVSNALYTILKTEHDIHCIYVIVTLYCCNIKSVQILWESPDFESRKSRKSCSRPMQMGGRRMWGSSGWSNGAQDADWRIEWVELCHCWGASPWKILAEMWPEGQLRQAWVPNFSSWSRRRQDYVS